MNNIILSQLPLKNYKILGIVNNVVSFSTRGIDKYVPNYLNGIFTGIRWQCVEFVRRYMIINKRITFQEVDNAYDIFNLKYFISLSNDLIPINKNFNGSKIPPKIGSLLIWNKYYDRYDTGHVSIIINISYYFIEVAEQCIYNDGFTKKFRIIRKNGFYIIDKNISGWINY